MYRGITAARDPPASTLRQPQWVASGHRCRCADRATVRIQSDAYV